MTIFRFSPARLAFTLFAACFITQHAVAQTSPGTTQTPMPPGPFSSWPEDAKKPAVVSLSMRCGLIGTMMLGNYAGPKEAAKEIAQALALACIDHQMPSDWPGHYDLRATLKQHTDAAHELDPKFPDPATLMAHLPPG